MWIFWLHFFIWNKILFSEIEWQSLHEHLLRDIHIVCLYQGNVFKSFLLSLSYTRKIMKWVKIGQTRRFWFRAASWFVCMSVLKQSLGISTSSEWRVELYAEIFTQKVWRRWVSRFACSFITKQFLVITISQKSFAMIIWNLIWNSTINWVQHSEVWSELVCTFLNLIKKKLNFGLFWWMH